MNMPVRRNQPASRYAPFSRVGYAGWVCAFEIKILRVIRVLAVHIAARLNKLPTLVRINECWRHINIGQTI